MGSAWEQRAVPNTQNAGGNLLLTRSRDHHPVAVCILPRRAAQQPLGGNAARSEGLSIPAQENARRSGPSSIAQEVQAVVGPAASTASLSCPIAGNGEAALQDAPRCSARATDRRGAALYVTSTQKTLPKDFPAGSERGSEILAKATGSASLAQHRSSLNAGRGGCSPVPQRPSGTAPLTRGRARTRSEPARQPPM